MPGIKWKKWCPSGVCGKTVVFDNYPRTEEKGYICLKCHKRWSKEELKGK